MCLEACTVKYTRSKQVIFCEIMSDGFDRLATVYLWREHHGVSITFFHEFLVTSSKRVHEPYIWPKRPKSYERAWRGPIEWCINYIVHHLVWGQLPTQKDGKYPWPFLLGHLLHRVVKIKKDKSYWWGGWGVWSANSLSQVYNKCIRQIELCREKSFGAAAKASIKTSSIQWKSKTK